MSAQRRQVLITGGAGFIGTNLAERLLQEGRRVLVFDNLARPGVEENLRWLEERYPGQVGVRLADVRDRVALRAALADADAVFHLAAQVAVTTSLDEPVADFEVNLGGTVGVLEELRRLRRPVPLLFTSTNKVYGALPDVPLERAGARWQPLDAQLRRRGVGEARPLEFCTPYGCSKGGADQYVLDYSKTFGLPAVVFRMSCIYGAHQRGTEDQGWVAHFLLRALAGEPVTVYGDGAQVRDVLFASDLVDAMVRVHEDIERLTGAAYNVGGGPANTLSLLELLRRIEEMGCESTQVTFADERPGDQKWYVSDTSRLREATGWTPQIDVEQGVVLLHQWLSRAPVVAIQAKRCPPSTMTRRPGSRLRPSSPRF